VEAGHDLAGCLRAVAGPVLVDSLGPWVAAHAGASPATNELCGALRRSAPTVVVSDEVGLSVHPETAVGRRFRDELGAVNQAVAAVADEVLLVVAGRVLVLPPAPGR
jgi:adenosyl cobinamide kinase/adenosyl cobinamide phosphate guanylyltransferase